MELSFFYFGHLIIQLTNGQAEKAFSVKSATRNTEGRKRQTAASIYNTLQVQIC